MRCMMRLLPVSFCLLSCLSTVVAENGVSTAHDGQCHSLITRRALRHQRVVRETMAAAESVSDDRSLPVRVYRLKHVESKDVRSMIESLLSPRGTVRALSAAEASGDAAKTKPAGKPVAGEMLVVRDCEDVLKRVDRTVAQIDVRPPAVLIEAEVVLVTLDEAHKCSGVSFAPSDVTTKGAGHSSAIVRGGKKEAKGVEFAAGKSQAELIRALAKCGTPEILAAPRLLVLNKQLAECFFGHEMGYTITTVTADHTIQEYASVKIGTELQATPFVSSDGMIRLELKVQRTTGHEDIRGIPQTNTIAVTTNVMIPDGTTAILTEPARTELVSFTEALPILNGLCLGSLLDSQYCDARNRQLVVLVSARVAKPQVR